MKIVVSNTELLELRGVPGGGAAIVVPVGLGVVGGLAVAFHVVTGATVPLVAGGVMVVLAGCAAVVAWTARETLTLNLAARTGRYVRTSFLRSERANVEFQFAAVDSVSVERERVKGPGKRGGGGGGETTVWRARLRLSRPRRAIVLAESQGGTEQRVRPVAEAVASGLGVALVDLTGEEAEIRRGREIGSGVGAGGLAEMDVGAPPRGSRVRLTIEPERQVVVLEWKTVGGAALPVMGLVAVGFFGVIATALALQAVSVPVLSWVFGQAAGAPKAAPPGITAALVAMAAACWAAWGLILELWLVSRRRLTITPERVTLMRVSPSASVLGAMSGGVLGRRWSVETGDVHSIRTHEDSIEVRVSERTHAAMIHLPAEGEVAWAVRAARFAVRACAGDESGAP